MFGRCNKLGQTRFAQPSEWPCQRHEPHPTSEGSQSSQMGSPTPSGTCTVLPRLSQPVFTRREQTAITADWCNIWGHHPGSGGYRGDSPGKGRTSWSREQGPRPTTRWTGATRHPDPAIGRISPFRRALGLGTGREWEESWQREEAQRGPVCLGLASHSPSQAQGPRCHGPRPCE